MQDSKKLSVSVVIPNYNGAKILEKNLPKVLEVTARCEVIIVDDGSMDNSVQTITKYTSEESSPPLRQGFAGRVGHLGGAEVTPGDRARLLDKRGGRTKRSGDPALPAGRHDSSEVKLIQNKKNLGFSSAVNRGVSEAMGDLILLLNTDAVPEKDFLMAVLPHFKDPQIFAVSLCDKSFEGEEIVLRGRGTGKFKRGFLFHHKAPIQKGISLWANGGSGVFRKEIWQKLDGLDELYNPFYWEDVDLGYRAWKSGYKIIFEPGAKINHYHEEGAIKKEFSQNFIKTVSYRNQFVFFWKNITDRSLIFSHLFWLPINLVWAITRLDLFFWMGFLKALVLLPQILKKRLRQNKQYQLSDKEVLDIFKS